ncbi:RNA pseudouridylate synthase domain-containing protein 2 isoform X2 [Engraulis encrasicolus]
MESEENSTPSAANTSGSVNVVGKDVNDAGDKRKSANMDTEESEEKRGRKKRKRGGGGKQLKPGERYVPPPQKRRQGVSFGQEHFDETSYYFEGGLRKVHPYFYDFSTYCKGRWIGKTLLEVFSTEFRSESVEYYQKAVKAGRIRLNNTPVDDLNITLKNNDLMRNTVHRHEPPVVGHPLVIIEENEEVVVVDKPASLPVHPCGRFRHNTVIFILGKEKGLSELHTVHRLDRLTSGILLFARTLEVSQKLDQMVRDRQLEKEYVCRVEGEFPERELVCEEPILVVSFRVGVCRVDPKGKPSRTVFQRLSWNGHSSVVRCRPVTGRTHQIRVHLQYLGYPILNDPVYGSSAWGPNRAKGGLVGMSDEELLDALVQEHRTKESLHLLDMPDENLDVMGDKAKLGEGTAALVNACEDNKQGLSDVSNAPTDAKQSDDGGHKIHEDRSCTKVTDSTETVAEGEQVTQKAGSEGLTSSSVGPNPSLDPLCQECKIVRRDPTEKELVMYLHALKYKGPGFEYSSSMPDWAKEDWVED